MLCIYFLTTKKRAREKQKVNTRRESIRETETEETKWEEGGEPRAGVKGEGREGGAWAHLLLGATLALPDVGGHDALHLLPQPGVLLELGGVAGERATYTGGTCRGHPNPTRIQGRGVGGTHRMPHTWGPRKLMAPSHSHPFPLIVGSKWQVKGLPSPGPSSLAYLGNFTGAGSSHEHKCLGNQPAPRPPSWWQPSWKQTYSIEASVWGAVSAPNFQ